MIFNKAQSQFFRAREKAAEKEEKHHSPTEFRRDENDEKITFALPAKFNTEVVLIFAYFYF